MKRWKNHAIYELVRFTNKDVERFRARNGSVHKFCGLKAGHNNQQTSYWLEKLTTNLREQNSEGERRNNMQLDEENTQRRNLDNILELKINV